MHEGLAVHIDQHCAYGTNLLCNQRAEDLRRVSRSGGVILNCILVQKRRSRTIAHHQSVCSCSVMIGGGEVLIMQSSCSAGSNDNGLGSRHLILSGFHILEDSACHLSFVILNQLYSRGKIYHRNLTVPYLVAEHTHDLRSRIVLAGVHPLSGGSAAVCGNHPAVLVLIKHNAQVIEPLDCVRCFHNQAAQKLGSCRKMSAAEGVQIMLLRRIIFLIRSLDTALCHHGVGVTDTKLGHHHNVGTCLMRLDSCGRTGSAAADDQNIHIIIYFIQINRYI